MATKNRKRYQRRLRIGTIATLLFIGAAMAAGACVFVQVKNAHVECANTKRALEEEIRNLEKELESVSGRIETAWDRPTLSTALSEIGSELEPIRHSEYAGAQPSEIPTALASLAVPDSADFIFINVENPSG